LLLVFTTGRSFRTATVTDDAALAPPLAIRLFGPFEARLGPDPLPRLRSRKVQWLLALLALRAGSEVERAWLVGTLWPDSAAAAALANLRSSLKDLRHALGPQSDRLRSRTPHTLSLDLSGAEADVLTFDQAIARGDPASLVRAVGLYRGPLLEGCAEAWAFQERQPREQAYLSALETLAAQALSDADPAAAERYLRRVVAADPLRETAQRALMEALAAGGNVAAALLAYRDLRLLLHGEMKAEPDPATTALYRSLREAPTRVTVRDKGSSRAHPEAVASEASGSFRAAAAADSLPLPGVERRRVVLLYKRYAQPDEQVMRLLEAQLEARGLDVFIDRHLTIGVAWAEEIERRLRSADAVIPLVSRASMTSEMLQYELQIAREAAQRQGTPRLLPVRVRHTGSLPDALAAILDSLEYARWDGPQDDGLLVDRLIGALEEGPSGGVLGPNGPRRRDPHRDEARLPSSERQAALQEPAAGAVPLGSSYYLIRPVDAELHAAIARHDSTVLVKGARQMGKTSLLARGLQGAREAGDRVVVTDFRRLGAARLVSLEPLYVTLGGWLADQLGLEVFLDATWSSRLDPGGNFERYLRREVLGKSPRPLVWGMDEVDALSVYPFGAEVFALFRSFHGARSLDPDGPWDRLTLAMTYATEPHLLIQDIHCSPFNVGTRVTLDDFCLKEVAELNERYGRPLQDDEEVERYAHLLGGQPYLVHRGLQQMAKEGLDLAAFEAKADREEGLFGDHLKRLLVQLVGAPEFCEEVAAVLRGDSCRSTAHFFHLRSAGVLAGSSAREARLRSPLYARYLSRHLL
jgi:DNA-binding SARP family transcriptional activator